MPPKNDPAHRHSKQAPRAPRKSKPKFEVPIEPGESVKPVTWVYRTDEIPTPPPPAAPHPTAQPAQSDPLMTVGMSLFFAGAAAVGFVSLVALGLVAGPLGFARKFWPARI